MASNLYWRQFTRDGSEDKDHPADAAFVSANFVDFFGKWLQEGRNSSVDTMDALTRAFFGASSTHSPRRLLARGTDKSPTDEPERYKTQVFMVADGSFITKSTQPPGDWFSPHVRLLVVVTPLAVNAFGTSTKDWTLCIVGSSRLQNKSAFLQVASWNGKTFRYYQVRILPSTLDIIFSYHQAQ